jgi:hypothetical protein
MTMEIQPRATLGDAHPSFSPTTWVQCPHGAAINLMQNSFYYHYSHVAQSSSLARAMAGDARLSFSPLQKYIGNQRLIIPVTTWVKTCALMVQR